MEFLSEISILAAYIFILFLLADIAKTVISGIRGKPYEWITPKLFDPKISVWVTISVAFLVCYGSYEIVRTHTDKLVKSESEKYEQIIEEQTTELIECWYCSEYFPEEYRFESYIGYTMCPSCARKDLDEFLSGEVVKCVKCGEFYLSSDSIGLGICEKCRSYVTECKKCGSITYAWEETDDFSLCPSCMGRMYQNKQIEILINKWVDYGE